MKEAVRYQKCKMRSFPERRVGSSRRSHVWVNRDGSRMSSSNNPLFSFEFLAPAAANCHHISCMQCSSSAVNLIHVHTDSSPVSPALFLHPDLLLLAIRFRRESLVSKHRSAFGRVSPRPPGYSIRRHPVLTPHFQLIKQLLPPGKGCTSSLPSLASILLSFEPQSPHPTTGDPSS